MKIGFIGAGNLATALVAGASGTAFIKDNEFYAYDVYKPSLDMISHFNVSPVGSAQEIISCCDTVILAVKPKDIPALISQTVDDFKKYNPLVVSVAAGTELSYIRSLFGFDVRLIRIMPNLNASVNESATAVYCQDNVTPEEKESFMSFCESFGSAFEIDEELFAVFGVIAGCSPAFSYMYIDQLARAAVRFGMNRNLAIQVAAQAVKGSAENILNTHPGISPYNLVDSVCSPGGTTIEGVLALQANGFENAVNAAVEAAYNKDCKMREKNN